MIIVCHRGGCGSRLLNARFAPNAKHMDIYCAVCGEWICHFTFTDFEDVSTMLARKMELAKKIEKELEDNG